MKITQLRAAASRILQCHDIFISWSGDRSRRCADALRIWLPRVIQSVKPWISTHDLAKGSRWESVLAKELGQHIYGLICVTPENRDSPWLNYEAGALSKTDSSRTFTLLIGLNYADVEQPLAQFNHTLINKNDMLALVRGINEAAETKLSEELLFHSFETNWSYVEEEFSKVLATEVSKPTRETAAEDGVLRNERSILEEILQAVRSQSNERRQASDEAASASQRDVLFQRRMHLAVQAVRLVLKELGLSPDYKVAAVTNAIAVFNIDLGDGRPTPIAAPLNLAAGDIEAFIREAIKEALMTKAAAITRGSNLGLSGA